MILKVLFVAVFYLHTHAFIFLVKPTLLCSCLVFQDITIKRARVNLSPVYSTALKRDQGLSDVGYIRLTQFSNNSAEDMRTAIMDLEVGQFIYEIKHALILLVQFIHVK